MSVMTMVEFLKTEAPDLDRGIVRKFIETSELLRAMPFEDVPGSGTPYNQQAALPSTTSRAVGETYTHSQGVLDPGFEPLKIFGGQSTFDTFQVRSGRGARRAQEIASFVESVALNFDKNVIKGDSSTNPRDLEGLQNKLTDTNTNLYSPGAGAGTMYRFKTAKKMARNPTHWIMGEGLKIRVDLAANNTSVGGYITRGEDALGKEVTMLTGLPIIVIKQDAADSDILDFSEASSSTSAYCVSLQLDRMHGQWHGPPTGQDLGIDPTNGTQLNFVIDWDAGYVLEHPRSAVRYSGITDAAITLQ